MGITKIVMNRGSQAVRLPKQSLYESITAALDILEHGFEIKRKQPNKQNRKLIKR